jgi:hypothetical protein
LKDATLEDATLKDATLKDATLKDVTWYAFTDPYYGADDEYQQSLSTSGKLFYPYVTSTKVEKIN